MDSAAEILFDNEEPITATAVVPAIFFKALLLEELPGSFFIAI